MSFYCQKDREQIPQCGFSATHNLAPTHLSNIISHHSPHNQATPNSADFLDATILLNPCILVQTILLVQPIPILLGKGQVRPAGMDQWLSVGL